MSNYFIHESAYVDEGAQKYGTSAMFLLKQRLGITAI
jgi:hypothetical protein